MGLDQSQEKEELAILAAETLGKLATPAAIAALNEGQKREASAVRQACSMAPTANVKAPSGTPFRHPLDGWRTIMTAPRTALPQSKRRTAQAEPLLTHEKSLSQKIGQGSEAGDILDQQLAMLGFQLITQLNTLIKTSRIHGRTNAALDKPVETMLTLIQTLANDHPVTLRIQNDFSLSGRATSQDQCTTDARCIEHDRHHGQMEDQEEEEEGEEEAD